MSSTAPPQLDTSHAPNPIEMFWDRNRTKMRLLFYVLMIGVIAYYGLQYYNRKQHDAKWAAFAQSIQLDVHEPDTIDRMELVPLTERFLENVDKVSVEELESRLAQTGPTDLKRAYLLWLLANKAFRDEDFAAARTRAQELLSGFPQHPLCTTSDFPIQMRLPVIEDEPEEDTPATRRKETEYEPQVAGSTVGLFLTAVDAAEAFKLPARFNKPEIPADAPRYRIEFSEPFGSMTIALMTKEAPEHCRVFQELVAEAEGSFWKGIKVDQIYSPNPRFARFMQGMQFHFGFPSTREADRTKWDTSKPADEKYVVDEVTGLSNWEGAIAARANADGKSEVNRLWVCVEDRADQDESRQVFAFVVEGLDAGREIVKSGFERSEDENSGTGRPAENIEIVSVTKVD